MKKLLLLITRCLIFLFYINLLAQEQHTYIIYFDNKDQLSDYQVSDLLSRDGLNRREVQNISIDDYDLPVKKSNIDYLLKHGVTIKSSSRWLNACLVTTHLDVHFIKENNTHVVKVQEIKESEHRADKFQKKSDMYKQQSIDYGEYEYYATKYNIQSMHDQGYFGNGVKVAFVDVGFSSVDTSAYFDDIFVNNQVIDTWNFISDSTDVYKSSIHGSGVMSPVVVNKPGKYVGLAPEIDLYLYLTDAIDTETPIDEFYAVKAFERSDSLGVEIINVSLGYQYFDDSNDDYSYNDLDGQTAISTLGANVAANKGIIMVISAGNGGDVTAPADAFGILSVGGTQKASLNYDGISSYGPLVDGRSKPDISAITRQIKIVYPDQAFIYENNYGGTSIAAPQITGIAACLKEKYPNASKDQIITAINESGHIHSNPTEETGSGVPNAQVADSALAYVLSDHEWEINDEIVLYPNPNSGTFSIRSKIPVKSVDLYAYTGELLRQNIDFNGNMIELIGLEPSVFVLNIQLENNAYIFKKIIIKD